MSLYRSPRVILLLVLSVLALLVIWHPWKGLSLEARGIRTGIDLSGGSRVIVQLEVTQAVLKVIPTFTSDQLDDLQRQLSDFFLTNVWILSADLDKKEVTVEIGKLVEENALRKAVENFGDVLSTMRGVASLETMEEVMNVIQARIDPAGLLGVQARPAGTNLILFEIPVLEPEKARMLIEKEGRLEFFIEDNIVMRGGDILAIRSPIVERKDRFYEYTLGLYISSEAAKRFAEASQGKAGYPLAIYLDRPIDAVLVFADDLPNEFSEAAGYPCVVEYSKLRKQFYYKISQTHGSYLLVYAAPLDPTSPTEEQVNLLRELRTICTRAIILGDNRSFSENAVAIVGEIFENRIEFFPRERREVTDWIFKAGGLHSAPRIMEGIAGKEVREPAITGTRITEEEAIREAKELRTVLSQRLAVKTSIVSTTYIPPRLGEEFVSELKKTMLVIVAVISVFLLIRYRNPLLVLAILVTMGCEVLLTVGAASALRQVFGLAEIGGILVIMGTGVEHQIIITDEILRREVIEYRRGGIRFRIKKAFGIILTAALTTVAAMFMLLFIGFGAMKGFGIITIIGVFIAVTITRPAYGDIVGALLEKRLSKEQK